MSRNTLRLLDVSVDNLNRAEAMQRAEELLDQPRFHQVVTPGPEFLLEAMAHPKFRDVLNRADLSLADGFGLHVGARLTGQHLRARLPGVDFIHDVMKLAAERQARVFLFGGAAGVAERAGKKLLSLYPGLNIVGLESGWRGNWTKVDDRRVVERIHLAQPDILLVALGAPKQELWIDQHRQALHRVRLAIGVGRTFDYLAGTIKRAPPMMRRTGLEWLHTYLLAGQYYQPQLRRQRVTNATVRFMIEVLKHRHAVQR